MRKYLIVSILSIASAMFSHGQSVVNATASVSSPAKQQWMNDVNDMGVSKKNDSLYVSPEVVKLLKDPEYRKTVYPTAYNWPTAVDLLNKMEFKKAFWQMINLYEKDTTSKNIVVGTFILYDSLMEMDKVLLNSFYTYAFTDPEISHIANNKPEIYRPDILEKKLRLTKDIIGYIWAYRKQKAESVKN